MTPGDLQHVPVQLPVPFRTCTARTQAAHCDFAHHEEPDVRLAYAALLLLICVWGAGAITTLGRGGSDLTATCIAAALGVQEAQVWKDVDGGPAPLLPVSSVEHVHLVCSHQA